MWVEVQNQPWRRALPLVASKAVNPCNICEFAMPQQRFEVSEEITQAYVQTQNIPERQTKNIKFSIKIDVPRDSPGYTWQDRDNEDDSKSLQGRTLLLL